MGLSADIVALERDPESEIRALSEVAFTMRDGVMIYGDVLTSS